MTDYQNNGTATLQKLMNCNSISRYSHLEMLRELVRLKAEINKAGDDDMTPLHYAAR